MSPLKNYNFKYIKRYKLIDIHVYKNISTCVFFITALYKKKKRNYNFFILQRVNNNYYPRKYNIIIIMTILRVKCCVMYKSRCAGLDWRPHTHTFAGIMSSVRKSSVIHSGVIKIICYKTRVAIRPGFAGTIPVFNQVSSQCFGTVICPGFIYLFIYLDGPRAINNYIHVVYSVTIFSHFIFL